MGFGDWIKGAFAQINPFDNGANFETYNPKKKKDEQNQSSSLPVAPKSNPNQPQLQAQKPKNAFQSTDLRLPGSTPGNNSVLKPLNVIPVTQPVKSPQQQEIDAIAARKLPDAEKNVSKGQGIIGAVSNFFTGNNNRIATQNARNQAVTEYQDKHGWNNDPGVTKYIGNTVDMGKNTSAAIKTQGKNLNKFQDGAYNAAGVLQYVPVAGSVLNVGLAGAQALADQKTKEDIRNTRNKIDFGMTNAEFDALDSVTKGKLETIRNIGLAASPLDFTGLGGLAKAEGVGLAKKGVVQLVKKGAIDEATKVGLKTVGKATVKAAIPAAILGGGVSAGAQAYLTGNVDPLEAAKAALMTGGTSLLIPSQGIRNVEKRSVDQAAIEVARVAAEGVTDGGTKIKVQQPKDINVTDVSAEASNIPVTNNTPTPTNKPIVEVSGDTPGVNQVKVPTPNEVATTRFNDQAPARPDTRIEGVTPTNTGNTGLFTRAEINTEQTALDTALKNGEIDPNTHKAASNELSQLTAADDAPKGQKIDVKQVNSIPVTDQTTVATSLPETPGTVRVTDSTAPNVARSAEVAAQSPVSLPAETQAVLDNPKQFNKRQVAAARNQRKLANQMAKTQEQTAAALDRIQTASPGAQSGEGFVPTGEFGKSVNGGAYQKTNRAAEMQQSVQETANLSPTDVIGTARANAAQNGGGFNRRDIRNIAAMFETKRIVRGTPEWQEARQILKEDGTNWGQTGALRNYTMRRTASPDELISRFESKIYRLAEDPSKIDSKLFDQVDAAETKFTDTRDAALQAYNRFTEAPTSANAKVYHAAQNAADAADKEAKMVEFKVASKTMKGNKDIKQARELEKMAQSADMYQMDAVDASMLSGTGTFVRNFVNSAVGGAEEGILGRISARIASKVTGEKVGGGFGRGSASGFGEGAKNVVDASKARAGEAGRNPLDHAKNWATTGNQLGDTIIDSQVKSNVIDHYTQILKDEGFTGRELTDRAGVMARQDPSNVSDSYTNAARVAAGLGSGVTRNNKIESVVKNILSDAISGGNPNKYTENVAKLVTRMTLGFPTAIGRSVAEGAKRFTLGAPTFIKAIATKDPQARAMLIKEGIKQAGSGGLIIPSLFYALGTSGAITGAYPSDQGERDKWQREGITENSIKIGDSYYQLPAYLGSWAVPGLFYASLGRNGGDWAAAAADTAKTIPSLLPIDQMSNVTDVINGRSDLGKFMSQTGASAVRAATPAGALLNQIAKSLDPTQNDTNGGNVWENLVSKVISGIPVASLTLPDKTDAVGNTLVNPNPLALAVGAASTSQDKGVARSGELNNQTNSTVQAMSDLGAFGDPNLKAILTDDKMKKIYTDIAAGKQASPDDIKKLQDAMVKGVSATGEDTAYLEKEQYDTNVSVLSIKRGIMAADPTTKPSDLAKMDTAIKRGQVYKDNTIPYDLISEYQSVGVADWRSMGDPENDAYNPDMYQRLWAIDQAMTQAGVSYKKGDLTGQKYSAKKAGSGRGGSKSFSSDFGTLKTGTGAPTVKQYATIDQKSGGVPIIQVQRPNIVHKIGISG